MRNFILVRGTKYYRMFKLRTMRWAGHVAYMGEVCLQSFDTNLKSLEDLCTDGRIIFKWPLEKQEGGGGALDSFG
jgi:hypothetical protein